MTRIVHEGHTYYSVSEAAKFLGTTTPKVREMMGNGILEWAQFRENGKLFVSSQSLIKKKQSLVADRYKEK